MRFAMYLPTALEFADVRLLAELARETEAAGWDGVFTWDVIAFSLDSDESWPLVDTWVALGAIALVTERVRIGPMVTAVARRRPAKLARETATVDRLSRGRLILGVGLGAAPNSEFEWLGEDADPKVRAEKLDEGLAVLTRLWSGEVVDHEGKHHHVRDTRFLPTPTQSPRIPIWVGGLWPHKAPLRRALRWDGFFPTSPDWPDDVLAPADYREMTAVARGARGDDPFDLAFTTTWAGDRPSPDRVAEYADAGVTWWIQGARTVDDYRRRMAAGPPRV